MATRKKATQKKDTKAARRARASFFDMRTLHAAKQTLDGGVSIVDPVLWRRMLEAIVVEKKEQYPDLEDNWENLLEPDEVAAVWDAARRWQEERPNQKSLNTIESECHACQQELESLQSQMEEDKRRLVLDARIRILERQRLKAQEDIRGKAYETVVQLLAAEDLAAMDEEHELPRFVLRRVNTRAAEAAAMAGRGAYEREMRESLGLGKEDPLPGGLNDSVATAGLVATIRYAIAGYDVEEVEGWIPPPGTIQGHVDGEAWQGTLSAGQARELWDIYEGGSEAEKTRAATAMMLALTVVAEACVEELAALKKGSALRLTRERVLRLLGLPKTGSSRITHAM